MRLSGYIYDDGLNRVRTAQTSFQNCTNPFRTAVFV